MGKHRFKIASFTNATGSQAWRLSGTLNGERIRKNFKTRQEAVAERQKLDIRQRNEAATGQTVWTTLTQEDNQDAIAAVSILKRSGSNRSLTDAVNYFVKHYKEAGEEKRIDEAIEEYLETKRKDLYRGVIAERQELSIRGEMRKLREGFAGRLVGEITSDDVKAYLDKPAQGKTQPPTLKTWNNRRGYLTTFFKFCLINRYVGEDPMLRVPKYRVKHTRGTAETISAEQAAKLMRFLETYRGQPTKRGIYWGEPGCLVPFFALALFAGVRPDWKNGEIGKLRPKDIRMDTGVIIIEPEVSKTNERRVIKIQPNLRAWLERYPLEDYPIIPKRRLQNLYPDVRKSFKLGHDVLRHTFISMLVAKERSVGDVALQAGNSEAVIRRHYLDLKSEDEAEQFWNITAC